MKNRHLRSLPCALIFVALFFLPSHGKSQPLGTWTFNNLLSGIPGIFNTVSAVSFGPGIPSSAFNGGAEFYGQGGWPSGALNTNAYLQFSLTPASGYQLDLTSLVVRIRRSNTGSPSGSGPTSWAVRSSLDGYAADLATGSMTHNYANYTVALGSGFHSLHTTITFRIYGYNVTTSSGGSSRMVFDQVTVSGLNIVLPVHITGLAGNRDNGVNHIRFRAFNGNSQTSYQIERSTDGTQYNRIISLSGNNQPDQLIEYSDHGIHGAGNYYYRVKVLEDGGHSFYSNVILVRGTEVPVLYVAAGKIHLPSFNGKAELRIYNSSGAIVYQCAVTGTVSEQILDLPRNLSAGVYVLQCRGSNIQYSAKAYLE